MRLLFGLFVFFTTITVLFGIPTMLFYLVCKHFGWFRMENFLENLITKFFMKFMYAVIVIGILFLWLITVIALVNVAKEMI